MPPACRRMSRSPPAGTRAWPRSLDRLRRKGSRRCSSRDSIGPETERISWDPIWGNSATEADAFVARDFPFRATLIRKDTVMDLLAFAKNIADRVEAHSARTKVPVAVSVIDIHGNILLQHRMSGAPVFSIEISERKAY